MQHVAARQRDIPLLGFDLSDVGHRAGDGASADQGKDFVAASGGLLIGFGCDARAHQKVIAGG